MMQKFVKMPFLWAALALFIGLGGCETKAPVSPDNGKIAGSSPDQSIDPANTTNGPATTVGPISNEMAAAVKAPASKITRKPGELHILKASTPEGLAKRFIASWYVPKYPGGWIYAGDDLHGRTWLYFPPYALSSNTIVTIDWESTGLLEGGVEFYPDGTQFNTPVTVWISYKDVNLGNLNPEDLRLWYWNENTQLWELIGDTVDLENQMVGGLLNHFSRYAIGSE